MTKSSTYPAPRDIPSGIYSRALLAQIEAKNFFSRAYKNGDFERFSRQQAGMVELALEGETYYLSPPIISLISAASESVPDTSLQDDLFLVPPVNGPHSAFFWLDGEYGGVDIGHPTARLHALAFHSIITFSPEQGAHEAGKSTMFVTAFTDSRDISEIPDYHVLYPIGQWQWREGEPLLSLTESIMTQRAMRFFLALLLLVKQELLTHLNLPAARHIRRQLERKSQTALEPLIRVIKLRRIRRASDVQQEEHRDYSCQWIVRGHWRRQWYPAQNRHLPKWIAPYVKGPEDKPLKPSRATIYAVVR